MGGAASVLLRKPRSYAEIYNDLDAEIVNFFVVLRDNGDELLRRLSLTPFARQEFIAAYGITEDPIERARRTAIKSLMGFGSDAVRRASGFRSSSNRSGTTPSHDWATYPTALGAVVKRLQGVVIERRDANTLIRAHDGPDTLHYVDPPYVHSTRTGAKRYAHEMTDADHVTLAETLLSCRGKVIVSGYPSPLYDHLFKGWRRVERSTFADGALPRTEVLWLNFDSGPTAVPLFT